MDFLPSNSSNADLLAEILDTDLSVKASLAVKKGNYRELVVFGNLLSFSMQQVLQLCPRKFQLIKLTADLNEEEQEGNCDFAFGHAVGAGVAVFDSTEDLRQAMFAAFLAWNIDLLEEPFKKENRAPVKKNFFDALWALQVYKTFRDEETDLSEYDIVKVEATVAVDFEDGHFYVGHIDELLQHKETKHFKIKENKTTAFAAVDPAIYANQDQALSYAAIIAQAGESEYDVLYAVYSSTEQRWMKFEFTKTVLSRAEWLQGQFFFHQQLEDYQESNLFPKNGSACMQYNRRCQFFGSCDYNKEKVFGKRFSELKRLHSLEELGEIEHLDYAFKFSELRLGMQKVIPITLMEEL